MREIKNARDAETDPGRKADIGKLAGALELLAKEEAAPAPQMDDPSPGEGPSNPPVGPAAAPSSSSPTAPTQPQGTAAAHPEETASTPSEETAPTRPQGSVAAQPEETAPTQSQGTAVSQPATAASEPELIHPAPTRTTLQAARDTAVEVLYEMATQFIGFIAGNYGSQPINHAVRAHVMPNVHPVLQDITSEEILTHVISSVATGTFLISAVVDTLKASKLGGKIDWEAVTGRIAAVGVPFGLWMNSIRAGTAGVSGVPLTRAVIATATTQLAKLLVGLDTHSNPMNDDPWIGKIADMLAYGAGWTLSGSPAGYFQDYVTGSSGLAADKFGNGALGMTATAAAYAATEGLARTGFGDVRHAFTDVHGRRISKKPGETDEEVNALDDNLKRARTASNLKFDNIAGIKSAPLEIWKQASELSKTTLFYGYVFENLGDYNKIGDQFKTISHAFRGGVVEGMMFGVGLPIFRAANKPIKKEEKNYTEYTSFEMV